MPVTRDTTPPSRPVPWFVFLRFAAADVIALGSPGSCLAHVRPIFMVLRCRNSCAYYCRGRGTHKLVR